jgi:hypothetical protein
MFMEHFYNSIPGFFSFKKLYYECVRTANNDSVWVEIGSWQGQSIAYAVVEAMRQNKNIKFHVVDKWLLHPKHFEMTGLRNDAELYKRFIKNMQPIIDKLTIYKQDSALAARNFEDNSIDVCMIDANHDYDYVLRDIIAWYPKMKKGGILLGDDCNKTFPGVEKAIKEFTQAKNLNYTVKSGTWILHT